MKHATGFDLVERLRDVRGERENVYQLRRGNHQNDHAERHTWDVLLELQIAVGGDQSAEP